VQLGGMLRWSIVLEGRRRDKVVYAAFGSRSQHETQPHRNLAGGSIAPAEHQRPENTSYALGLEGKQAHTTAEC
jgi:hypothetical protein